VDKIKAYCVSNFEQITVLVILLSVIFTSYAVDEKMIMLNFFYLPVLLAGYYIGKKASLLVAVLSVLAVALFALLNTHAFSSGRGSLYLASSLCGWGGFLILTSHVVGTLSEQKEKKMIELQRAYVGVLEILVKYLESNDPYTKGHSERVADHAMSIAIAMELPRSEVENIRVAALLHDIGKIDISGELIRKSANLTEEEMARVAQHSEKGAKILLSVGSILRGAIPIVLEHHKYFNEMDKPTGKRTKPASVGTRIVAVADSFDAMTTDRPYRKGIQPWQAMEELRRCSGEQFDPEVVKVFELVLAQKIEAV
jgi:putative nucleotidyltransferase with HDIG domain